MKYSIAIAGSTKRTTLCAETLKSSEKFEIAWILTPVAKPVGREKIVSPNPLDAFAKENSIPTVHIERKIDDKTRAEIEQKIVPDFLIVVDFGYIAPSWLLETAKIAPLNIHPSQLPKWRGSSPGQFSILFNDKKSAVTLMIINNKLDQGPIIHQDSFEVSSSWTQAEYYSHAFKLICNNLDEKIEKFALNPSIAKEQPESSPTITAGMLKKDHAFIPWEVVKTAVAGKELVNKPNNDKESTNSNQQLSKIIATALDHNHSLVLTLERASKAFSPWPQLWTIIPTQKGEKRMKLLELEVDDDKNNDGKKLLIKKVQVEGKNPSSWSDAKDIVIE